MTLPAPGRFATATATLAALLAAPAPVTARPSTFNRARDRPKARRAGLIRWRNALASRHHNERGSWGG